jgi:hypothetical protein
LWRFCRGSRLGAGVRSLIRGGGQGRKAHDEGSDEKFFPHGRHYNSISFLGMMLPLQHKMISAVRQHNY